MKRILSVLLSLLLLLSCIPAGAVMVAAEEWDEAVSGEAIHIDFEEGEAPDWYFYNQTGVATEAAYSGDYGLHLQGVGGWGSLAAYSMPVEAGQRYRVTMWMKSLSVGTYVRIMEGFTYTSLVEQQYAPTEWTQLEFFIMPSTDLLYLDFIGCGTYVNENVYVDDIIFTPIDTTPVEPVEPSFDGYITNGDFETGDTTGWNVWQDTVVSPDAAYNGAYGIYLQGNGSWSTMANQPIAVEKGKTYTLSFYAKVTSIGIIATIGDGTNPLMSQWLGTSAYADWALFEYEFTATTDSIVLAFCGTGSGAVESACVDNVTFAPVGAEPEPCYHEYDHEADPDCNLCGEKRALRYITLGGSEAVNITESYTTADFLFTPAHSGEYVFYSEGDTDAYGYIFDVYGTQLTSDDDGGSGNNFHIVYYMEVGVTYQLRAACYGSRTGSYTAYLTCNHVYGDYCDPDCNVCGEWREVYHSYDSDCDDTCNICNEWREAAEHVYYNVCDSYCDVCGAWREADHVYNTPCDEYCIECGSWRESAHVYDNGCDGECNLCGFTRSWSHVYDAATDTECNECGATRVVRYVTLNSTMDVVVTVGQTTDNYLFTPERSGYYIFTCDDIGDPYGHLYDAFGNWIASDDDSGSGNRDFYIGWYAEAGTTYELRAGFYSNNTGSYTAYLTCGHDYDDDCDAVCNTCDEVREAPHYFDNACDSECNGCGLAREVGNHYYSSDCDHSCNECGAWREAAEHVYDNACDGYCNLCGNWRDVYHVYDNHCDAYCNKCGEVRDVDGHNYDNALDTECNECGNLRLLNYITLNTAVSVTVENSYDTMNFLFTPEHSGIYHFYSESNLDTKAYIYDVDGNHLNENDDGGDAVNFYLSVYLDAGVTYEYRAGFWSGGTGTYTAYLVAEHVYDNDCDPDCNICGAIRDEVYHEYDTDCDPDCNVCGAIRDELYHWYDDECDPDCNECGAIREVDDHWYDNECDPDCNECGAIREVADHVFDNDCDEYCNECDEWRDTEWAHVYDTNCDPYCNNCGYEREIYHVYDNECDAYCNECGEERDVERHIYGTALDTDCNECGAVRVLNYISLNTPTSVTVDVVYGTMNFLFTPTESGEYTFYSSEGSDPYGYIYDVYGNELTRDDDSGGYRAFRIVYYMEAGVTYELRAGFWSDYTGSYTIYLTRTHVYDSVCDPDCNICGEMRDTYHEYDTVCDTVCNVCGAIREAADHYYDSDCDEYCNVCDTYRVTMIAPHTYDNDCDAYCNACGQYRDVTDHWYDDVCDAYCNECGAVRDADHVYDNNCDEYCNVCDNHRVGSAHVFSDAFDRACEVCGEERDLQYVDLNTDITVTVTRPRGTQCFLFIPEEDGEYILYSSNGSDPYGYIYGAYDNLFASDDDSGEGLEFRIVIYLYAGITYELRGGFWSDYTGTYTMRIERYVKEEHPEEPDEPIEPSFDGYITNGDFETGDTEGWELRYNTEISANAAYNGKFGLHLQGDGSWRVLATQSFDVEAGKTYVISMWVKAVSERADVIIRDPLFAGDLESRWVDNTEWTYVEFVITPVDTDLLYITFRGGDTGSIESVYVDDIRVACVVSDTCDHVYDHSCDEDCNLCGEWREVAGHVYDTACDEHCNYCGAWRPADGHVYDDDHDPDCNACGTLRDVFAAGDIDGNGRITMRDLALLVRYINSWDVEITMSADLNNDYKINVRDAGLLQQYLNGWDVTLV